MWIWRAASCGRAAKAYKMKLDVNEASALFICLAQTSQTSTLNPPTVQGPGFKWQQPANSIQLYKGEASEGSCPCCCTIYISGICVSHSFYMFMTWLSCQEQEGVVVVLQAKWLPSHWPQFKILLNICEGDTTGRISSCDYGDQNWGLNQNTILSKTLTPKPNRSTSTALSQHVQESERNVELQHKARFQQICSLQKYTLLTFIL